MKKIKFSRTIGMLMAIVTLVIGFSTKNVYAAGIETLPLNQWYTISNSFTVDDYNYTPMKTVQGRYLKLQFCSKVNLDLDSKATEQVQVTIRIRDYNTKQFIPGAVYTYTQPLVDITWGQAKETPTFDLGYAGRKVQIYTKISSYNSSDTSVRVVDFTKYKSYSSN